MCCRRTKTGIPERVNFYGLRVYLKSLSHIGLDCVPLPKQEEGKLEQAQLSLGPIALRKGNPLVAFSRCGNKLGGAWIFSGENMAWVSPFCSWK